MHVEQQDLEHQFRRGAISKLTFAQRSKFRVHPFYLEHLSLDDYLLIIRAQPPLGSKSICRAVCKLEKKDSWGANSDARQEV